MSCAVNLTTFSSSLAKITFCGCIAKCKRTKKHITKSLNNIGFKVIPSSK